jgi:hypothetical protein
MIVLGCVVEGDGEEDAIRVLIRRITERIDPSTQVRVGIVIRRPRGRLLKPKQLEDDIELAARRIGRDGAVLVLLDADDDCPAELGPRLLRRAQAAHADLALSIVVAKREFESWFLAAAESLRGARGLPADLDAPLDPEAVRGAKEWLSARMGGRANYSPTRHQAAFAAQFDLETARRADSFDKCWREVATLLALMRERA